MEHGRYLGLDPVYDAHLMWIAEESLCAPLPAFWEDHIDEQGNVYYRNRRTGQTSRYHPLDKKYKKKVLQVRCSCLAVGRSRNWASTASCMDRTCAAIWY